MRGCIRGISRKKITYILKINNILLYYIMTDSIMIPFVMIPPAIIRLVKSFVKTHLQDLPESEECAVEQVSDSEVWFGGREVSLQDEDASRPAS
jgi:hypothetical protein